MKKNTPHFYTTFVNYKDLDMYSVVYHPNYLALVDDARNKAFADLGYPIEEQLKDKVGFTVAEISQMNFKRPLFMGEKIDIYTSLINLGSRSCEIQHRIRLSGSTEDSADVFNANYKLVFVSIEDIGEFPLNAHNILKMKAIPFNEKAKKVFGVL